MCSKHDAMGFKKSLQEVMQRGYSLIDACKEEYRKISQLPEAERAAGQAEHERILLHLFRSVNDVLHPAHAKAKELFPIANHPFIDDCIANHQHNRKNGMANKCTCCPVLEEKSE